MFVEARALKAYAGSAPVIRASGRAISIAYRAPGDFEEWVSLVRDSNSRLTAPTSAC